MSKFYTTAGMVLVALIVCVGPAWAKSATQPAAAVATAPADNEVGGIGHIKGSNVYVRSGFAKNYYPVLKLNEGDKVTILRSKFGWLEILPPAGAYSVVDKARIDKNAEGIGVANGDSTQVYAGSDLDKQKYAKQVKLTKGDKVKIIGETAEGDFYKITPPEGATLWVRSDMVNRGDKVASKIEVVKPGELGKAVEEITTSAKPANKSPVAAGSTHKAGIGMTQASRDQIRIIEAEIAAEAIKPLADRKYDTIIGKLQPMVDQSDDIVTQTWAKASIESLRHQTDFTSALSEMKGLRDKAIVDADEIARRRAAIQAEAARWDVNPVVARGEIRASEMYTGSGGQARRWRLVDPKTDRTTAYIEVAPGSPIDPVQFYGKYVGVEATSYQLLHGSVPPLPVYLVKNVKVTDPNAAIEPIIRREALASPPSPSSQPAGEKAVASQPSLESSPKP